MKLPSMASSRRFRAVWTFLRAITITAAFLATFELGRLLELQDAKTGRALIYAARLESDDLNIEKSADNNHSHNEVQKDYEIHKSTKDTSSKQKAGEKQAIDFAVAGEAAAEVAANDVEHEMQEKSAEKQVENGLPADFWNSRREDDIFVDTNRSILNPHPFKRIVNNPSVCGKELLGANIFLLCYVHTAVDHFKARARIRETWGHQSNYKNTTIRVIFIMGRTNKAAWLQDALEYEARKYGDIVQEDFLDTYRNLSYKGVAALRWITTYCNRASYVLKTDDDMFVNMFALLKHLKDLHTAGYRRRLLMCYVWWRMHVLREGKWGIPKEEMPDDLYPVYCSGMGYVFTTDVAAAMYRVSYYERFFWVDDVYISGSLPRALRVVNHTELTNAYCGAHEMDVYWHPTEWYKYVFTHVHDDQLYMRTWSNLVQMARTKTIPTPNVIRPGQLAEYYIPKRVLFPENFDKKSKSKKDAENKNKKV